MSAHTQAFPPAMVAVATALGVSIQVAFFLLLALAGTSTAMIAEQEQPKPKERPIAVKPVMDDLPLLKLGGKKVRAKLPDMWKKQAPVKQYEAKSAPSPDAKDDVEDIPTSEVAKGDAEAPPPDAEVVAKLDDLLPDASAPDSAPNIEGPGSPNGVKEGTETDPLKARAVSQYKMKILAWFNARFTPPVGQIPCAELKGLSAAVSANVGGNRSVTGFSLSRPSGNAVFDAKVQATMSGIVGQQLPPPPPLYPDILDTSVFPVFSGRSAKCE